MTTSPTTSSTASTAAPRVERDPASLVDTRLPTEGEDRPPEAPLEVRRTPASVVTHVFQQYLLVLLLIASVVLYSVWSKTSSSFASSANLKLILGSQASICILTLGLVIPLVADQIDLSVGAIAGLSTVSCAVTYTKYDQSLIIGLLVGVGTGVLCGLLNGTIISVFRIPPFVTTLGTASVFGGVLTWYTAGQSFSSVPAQLTTFGIGDWFGIPRVTYAIIIMGLLIYYLLQHTPYGRNLHAVGSNRAAAELVGIRVQRSIFTAFILSGTAAGIAGVLVVARTGSGGPGAVPPQSSLTAIAAVFLGAASFKLGRVNVPGTVVGVFFIAINVSGLTFAGAVGWAQDLFSGISLVLAVGFATFLSRKRLREGSV